MTRNGRGATAAQVVAIYLTTLIPLSDSRAAEPFERMHAAGSPSGTIGSVHRAASSVTQSRALQRRAAVRRATEPDCPLWLYDYLERALDRSGRVAFQIAADAASTVMELVAPGPPRERRAGTQPRRAALASVGAPLRPAAEAVETPAASPPAGAPVITGALPTASTFPARAEGEAGHVLVEAAQKAQSALDLVKLELAGRTYGERASSGQSVFRRRADWRLLERAREAQSDAEQAAADAAGFEANAYINESERIIVVAIAGTQDLRRDFLEADVWRALIRAEAPQHFFMAKTYVRSVIQRYQANGFTTECVGHSLGGGACAYVAAELAIRAVVINPIAAGRLAGPARYLVTNYVVDGDIAQLVYGARGNELTGDVLVIGDLSEREAREKALERFGPMAGVIRVVRDLRASIDSHRIGHALDRLAAQAGIERPE